MPQAAQWTTMAAMDHSIPMQQHYNAFMSRHTRNGSVSAYTHFYRCSADNDQVTITIQTGAFTTPVITSANKRLPAGTHFNNICRKCPPNRYVGAKYRNYIFICQIRAPNDVRCNSNSILAVRRSQQCLRNKAAIVLHLHAESCQHPPLLW